MYYPYLLVYNDYLKYWLKITKIIKTQIKIFFSSALSFIFLQIPVTTTLFAPMTLATSKVNKPIGPAPRINTLESIPIPARLQVCTATDNGSKNAPSSKLTCSGNLLQKITNVEINFLSASINFTKLFIVLKNVT